jgi:signal transduction histidine kinase
MKCGITAIPDSEVQRWWQHGQIVIPSRVLDEADGAEGDSATLRPAASKSPDGRLWFANDTNLQFVDPRRLYENDVLPPVQIEGVIADRQAHSHLDKLQLPPRTRDLEINYTALSLVIPPKVRFRYRLDGHDPGWQEAGTRRQAFYNDLPPGQYRFYVIALLCVVLGLAALAAGYRLRVRQIAAATTVRFDERLAERTRLAREFHDILLQTIQGSKLMADSALKGVADSAGTNAALERLSAWLGEAVDQARSAVNSLRNPTVEGSDLAEALQRAGEPNHRIELPE